MATLTTISGKSLTLKVDSTSTVKTIKNLRSRSLSLSQDFDEVTTADSDEFKEYVPTFQDGTFDFSGKATMATDAELVTTELLDLFLAKTNLYWDWGTGVASSYKLTGRGYIASFQIDSEYDSEVEFSGTIQLTGDPTAGTYSA